MSTTRSWKPAKLRLGSHVRRSAQFQVSGTQLWLLLFGFAALAGVSGARYWLHPDSSGTPPRPIAEQRQHHSYNFVQVRADVRTGLAMLRFLVEPETNSMPVPAQPVNCKKPNPGRR